MFCVKSIQQVLGSLSLQKVSHLSLRQPFAKYVKAIINISVKLPNLHIFLILNCTNFCQILHSKQFQISRHSTFLISVHFVFSKLWVALIKPSKIIIQNNFRKKFTMNVKFGKGLFYIKHNRIYFKSFDIDSGQPCIPT